MSASIPRNAVFSRLARWHGLQLRRATIFSLYIGMSIALGACALQGPGSEETNALTQAAPLEAGTGPCCGPITAQGSALLAVLDGADVEHHWLNHSHVNWQTGVADQQPGYNGPDAKSHCSAFAAEMGERMGVYLLRPPEHPQQLLASAQTHWFDSADARSAGWDPVTSPQQAQSFANQGMLVVIAYPNPNPHRPGHIAVVRPSLKTASMLRDEGPEISQAGETNYQDSNARKGFRMHAGAWPGNVRYFVHAVPATST